MNKPSSTITAAAISGAAAGVVFIALAVLAPDIYLRLQVYPGAEAHLTTLIMAAVGYWKKENVLPLR